jgi:site-specific recombinase XerC
MMAVLLGCGLRRAELSALEVEDMEIRQEHWAIVDLIGKGSHARLPILTRPHLREADLRAPWLCVAQLPSSA